MSWRHGAGTRAARIGSFLITVLCIPAANSADLNLSRDGWHTWRVDAVDEAPHWCCAEWCDGRVQPKVCDLDGRKTGFHHMETELYDPSALQIQLYVLREEGKVVRLQGYSTSCAVTSASTVMDHGDIDTDISLDWLEGQLRSSSRRSDETLAAIAIHAGTRAQRVLEQQARDGHSLRYRKAAIFWMGQVRAAQSAEQLMALMFNDPNAKIRKHTAFSVSQTELAGRGAALARLGKTDASVDVRGEAWLWLAQARVADARLAILAALDREQNRDVRNQVVFALSQLPDAEGLQALITVLENQALPVEDRKQALFWMAQHDDDRAIDYLAALLKDG